jgi:hypothetical protein
MPKNGLVLDDEVVSLIGIFALYSLSWKKLLFLRSESWDTFWRSLGKQTFLYEEVAMGTTPTIAAQDGGRNKQIVTVDFFRLQHDAGGSPTFLQALRHAMRCRGADRSAVVWGERIDLYSTREDDGIIEGEIGRVRMSNTPAIAGRDCTVKEIDLEDEEGITERTAFLFDSRRSVLAVHSRREAVSASRLCGYCDKFANNQVDTFVIEPILRADAQRRFDSMITIKKVEVEYTREAAGAIQQVDQSTQGFLQGLRNLDGQTLTVSVSSGRKKDNKLSLENVTSFVRTAFAGRNERVEKLTISGRNAGDEHLFVDLLEDRLRVKRAMEFRGRSASYEQRRTLLREIYDQNLPLL